MMIIWPTIWNNFLKAEVRSAVSFQQHIITVNCTLSLHQRFKRNFRLWLEMLEFTCITFKCNSSSLSGPSLVISPHTWCLMEQVLMYDQLQIFTFCNLLTELSDWFVTIFWLYFCNTRRPLKLKTITFKTLKLIAVSKAAFKNWEVYD